MRGGGGAMTRAPRGRAANGRSSISRDPQGRWHGYVSMGHADDGTPVRRHVRAATRDEVTRKVQALEAERDRSAGRATTGAQLSFGDWLEEWLVIVQRTRKPKTFDNYTSLTRRHCVGLRRRALGKVTVRDIDDLLHRVAQSAPQSAVSLHRILRSCFNTALKRGLVGANPCQYAVVPRVREVEVEPYDTAQCHRILAAASGGPNPARWSVALALGLRQGEALGLQWADVDLEGRQVRVRR